MPRTVVGSLVGEVVSNMFVTALFLAAAIPDGMLAVETGSPDSLCPSIAQATQAIHARTGTIKSEQKGWLARYTLGHTPGSDEGDFIRLQLYDPQRQLRLSRDLPIRGASCATMAQSIAIVVGAFFTSLADAAAFNQVAAPAAATEALDEPRLDEEKRSSKPDQAGPATPNDPSPSPKNPSFEHELSAGVHVPFTSTSRGLTIGYALELHQRHQFGLHLALPMERIHQQAADGSVDMRSFRARLWYGATVHSQRFSLGFGPSLIVGIDIAEGSGLDQNFKQERLILAAGSIADATWWLHRWVGLSVQGGIDLTTRALCRRFLVETKGPESSQEVHAPKWLNGFIGLTLKISLSR